MRYSNEMNFNKTKHYDEIGHAHFVTFSCHKELPLFKDPYLCDMFVKQLGREREKGRFSLWAFVVMPEHVHVLLYPHAEMSAILRGLKQSFSFHALQYLESNHPDLYGQLHVATGRRANHRFWMKGGGHDRNIQDQEALRYFMEYIHNNPVKRGLVNLPEEWNWSSARCWVTGENKPLQTDEIPW